MPGTFVLALTTNPSSTGSWTIVDSNGNPAGGTLVDAVRESYEALLTSVRAGKIAPSNSGSLRLAGLKWYLDHSAVETLFADLPSGMRISAVYAAMFGGTNNGTGSFWLQFAEAVESGVISPNTDDSVSPEVDIAIASPPVASAPNGKTMGYKWKKFPYPTSPLPSPAKLQSDGVGMRTTVGAATTAYLDAVIIAGTYTQADPTVTNVSPSSGPLSGKAVTITGTNFQSGGVATVTFDGVPATAVVVVDDVTITCTAPAHVAGAVDVVVTLTGTGSPRSGTLDDGFTYLQPSVLTITPDQGFMTQQQAVSIGGTNFSSGGATTVTIGGALATSVVVVNDTTITCVTPTHAFATPSGVDVVVDQDLGGGIVGSGTLDDGYFYEAVVITDISPATPLDRRGGTPITLTAPGAIFDAGCLPIVTIDGAFAIGLYIDVLSPEILSFILPPLEAAGLHAVTITDCLLELIATAEFTVEDPEETPARWPPVDSADVLEGPKAGGLFCEIVRTGLFNISDPPTVRFVSGWTEALDVEVVDTDTLRFRIPGAPLATVVLVTIADGSGILMRSQFRYTE